MDLQTVATNVMELAKGMGRESQNRSVAGLDRRLFDRLSEAGYHLTGVPEEHGGAWAGLARSARPMAEMLRTLARYDASTALVAALHTGVLSLWSNTPQVATSFQAAWDEQRADVFSTVRAGEWWGMLLYEPLKSTNYGTTLGASRSVVTRDTNGNWRLSGTKRLNPGISLVSHMVTAAIPEGEDEPDRFWVNLHGVRLDGSAGAQLVAEWDGLGMRRTNSHTVSFDHYPARRFAWPKAIMEVGNPTSGALQCWFAGIQLGIIQEALHTARHHMKEQSKTFLPYEQVYWARAEMETWTAVWAYEGMIRAVETKGGLPREVVMGKVIVAEMAESVLNRLSKLMGPEAYSQHSTFPIWVADVQFFGIMRPSFTNAYDDTFEHAFEDEQMVDPF